MNPEQEQRGSARRKSRRGVAPLVLLIVVLLAVAVGGGYYLVNTYLAEQQAVKSMEDAAAPATPSKDTPKDERVQNPIDFAALEAENSDVFAWLYLPGCNINAPVFQSPTDDLFYLTHGADRQESAVGATFMQLANKQDLSDPVSVIYGHHIGGEFKDLHNFEDQAFLDANTEFYVYTPGRILTYTVVSAYEYDARHILNSFNFADESVRQQYFDFVQNPDSMVKAVNANAPRLDADSKLLQLSTCANEVGSKTKRYIVSAVQTGDQLTY